MTSDVTYLPHSLSAYILPELRGSLSQVRERKTKSRPRRRLPCKVGHGLEDSVLHGLTRGVGRTPSCTADPQRRVSRESTRLFAEPLQSCDLIPPFRHEETDSATVPAEQRELHCQLSRRRGQSEDSTGSVGAWRREAGAARPPLLPQPGPIARHPASRGAWHTLPLPPRVSPMACHPGAAVATDKRTCIPWSSRCMAVSSPCAEWPCDVRLHSKPP